jgi:hypothetical protein
MALRADEKLVVEAIARHYSATSREGQNPPDAYLSIHGQDILLEVTQLTEQVQVAGQLVPRRTHDVSGIRILSQLSDSLEAALPPNRCIGLILDMPVENPNAFKRDLENELRRIIPAPPDGDFELRIGNSTVQARFSDRTPGDKAVTGAVSNSAASPYVLANVKSSLTDRVLEKERICSALPFQGSRWLGLYNDYFLADKETYQQALSELNLPHSFQKILLVTDSGQVFDVGGEQ